MTQIERLTLKRFKQLKEFDLDLKDTTVLIGANNSGKSSVLQALHFAVSVAQTAKLVGEGVKWGNDKFELSFNPAQLLYSPIADVLSLAYGGQLQEPSTAQIEIQIVCSDGTKCAVAVRRGRNRNIGVSLVGRALGERLMDMDRPFTVYAPGLAGIPKEERYMSPGAVRRVVARGDANLVLRNVLLMLKKVEDEDRARRWKLVHEKKLTSISQDGWKGMWTAFQDDMSALFPGIKVEVKFDEARDENIEVFFTRPGKPRLPIDAAGTSILQASQILAYITLFKPSVLILDEPDSHLHPNNQRALCNLITELAAKRGFRALISTHSRHVLDALRDTASVVWVNDGKKVDYDSVSTASMLMEIGALDSVDYFTNGHLRCLFATEDSSPESLKALDALLRSNGFHMGDTEVRPYAGCSKIDSAKVLRSFLADKAPGVKFALHRDRDYMDEPAAQKFVEKIGAINAHPFLTSHSDVENYFLNAQHLAQLNPGLAVARAQELIDKATADTREKSVKKLINIRTEAAIRSRNGGPAHNAGDLATRAIEDYDGDPVKWRRGKVVLGQLRGLLHQELKSDSKVLLATPHLTCLELASIRDAIWPAHPAVPAGVQPNEMQTAARVSQATAANATHKSAMKLIDVKPADAPATAPEDSNVGVEVAHAPDSLDSPDIHIG